MMSVHEGVVSGGVGVVRRLCLNLGAMKAESSELPLVSKGMYTNLIFGRQNLGGIVMMRVVAVALVFVVGTWGRASH